MNPDAGHRRTVQPTLQDTARAVQELSALLPARLVGPERDAVEIALCEVLTNIVQHGFSGGPGAPIEVSLAERADALVIEVRDRGRAIPAERLAAAGPQTFAFDPDDLAALPQGGFGLALIKAAFDVVDYRDEAGVNCMHLEKRLA